MYKRQVCNCAERVYVHESIKEKFEEALFNELDKVKFGDPNKERGLDYGPLIEKQMCIRDRCILYCW